MANIYTLSTQTRIMGEMLSLSRRTPNSEVALLKGCFSSTSAQIVVVVVAAAVVVFMFLLLRKREIGVFFVVVVVVVVVAAAAAAATAAAAFVVVAAAAAVLLFKGSSSRCFSKQSKQRLLCPRHWENSHFWPTDTTPSISQATNHRLSSSHCLCTSMQVKHRRVMLSEEVFRRT